MKKIGNVIYFHENYINKYMNEKQIELLKFIMEIKLLSPHCGNNIIKLDTKIGDFSIITCKNFNTSREPRLLWGHKCYMGTRKLKTMVFSETNPPIYHSKHMFVENDYTGFDLEESKRWTSKWNKCVKKGDKKNIGTLKGWKEFLLKNKLEVM